MKIHMVKKGDTLYELSKKYGITLEKLIEANPQLKDPSKLNIGEKVKVPTESIATPMPEHIIHKHVVKQGDSLWQISKAWGVTLRDMIDANPQLKNPNALLVGEIVNIPKVGMNEVLNEELVGGNTINNKTTPGGKTNTGPKVDTSPIQTIPPVIPQLPQIQENTPMPNMTMPNMPAPNNAPIQQTPPQLAPIPLPELPITEEKIEMKQHLYIQYSVPTQEAVGKAPMMEKSNPCPQVSEQMNYPGITEGYSCNQPQWEHQGQMQQSNWAQPQFVEPCYPMTQMVQEGPNYCNPNFSPYGTSYAGASSGCNGDNQEFSPLSNNMAPLENISVICSNVYSCTAPYEWTYPQPMMQGQGNEFMEQYQAMSYGYSQPEAQSAHDCGCHSRELINATNSQELSQIGSVEDFSEKPVIENEVSNSNLVFDESNETKLKKAKISSLNTEKGRSANQVGEKKKEIKPKSRQKKRRNPWIKN